MYTHNENTIREYHSSNCQWLEKWWNVFIPGEGLLPGGNGHYGECNKAEASPRDALDWHTRTGDSVVPMSGSLSG